VSAATPTRPEGHLAGAIAAEPAGPPGEMPPPGLTRRARGVLGLLDRPLTSYYLVLGVTVLLLALGLVMVLSTTSAYQLDTGGQPYAGFQKQLIGVAAGLPLMWLAARCSPRLFRFAAYPLILLSVVGLVAVLAFGVTVNGAARWISVAGFQVQPSEFAKLGLILWGADLLARKERLGLLRDWRQLLIPLLPGASLICLLVLLGDDLGTTFVLVVIFLALLWVIGAPVRLFAGMLILMVFALALLIVVARYRVARLTCFINPHAQVAGNCWQLNQGRLAIGSGGWFGLGLGASRAKWGWLPDASTDFIFAIVGEELGLIGTVCVTALYGGLAFAGLRIARRVTDTFTRLAAAAITAWIVVQALVNIGAVLSLLPITGVPLPLVSAGLSSLLVTMVAVGMLLSFAKQEPGAREALAAAGPGPALRVLSWLGLPVSAGRWRAAGLATGPRPGGADRPAGRRAGAP
jgi:cell division protein FtsW